MYHAHRADSQLNEQEGKEAKLREKVGEFVGNVFYGTLMKEIQESSTKSEYLRGGRGEDIFRGQLNMELARRMGQAPDDPIANRLFKLWDRSDRAVRIPPAAGVEVQRLDIATGAA